MKKFLNMLQWAVLLALALYTIRSFTRSIPPPEHDPSSWSSWSGFHAISYAGVSRKSPDYVSPRRLAEHLTALRAAGYQTIFAEDAAAYLRDGAPLPEKAVLLLFEGGRKDALLAATPLLRELGQVAHMGVPTILLDRLSSFYVRKRDVAKLLRDPHWRVTSMGHRAVEKIDGRPFLVTRAGTGTSREDDAAYAARVDADFAAAAARLGRIGHTNVFSYLLPFADPGVSPDADPQAASIIAASLAAHHGIAWVRADASFNGPDSDPLALTRLRVPAEWDAATLLAELDRSRPNRQPLRSVGNPEGWALSEGARVEATTLKLKPGATAWLRGSSGWSDADVQIGIEREPEALAAIYLRYGGPDRYVRVSIDASGLRVQERIGREMETLATIGADRMAGDAVRQVLLRCRGNRLWLWIGSDLAAGPLPLTRHTRAGMVGFEALGGAVSVPAFSATPFPPTLVAAQSLVALREDERERVGHVILPWYAESSALEFTPEMRRELLQAGKDGIEVIPLVGGRDGISEEEAAAFAESLVRAHDDIVPRGLIRRVAVPGIGGTLAPALEAKGYGVVRTVTRAQAESVAAGAGATRGRTLAVISSEPITPAVLAGLHRYVPPHRLYLESAPDSDTAPNTGIVRILGDSTRSLLEAP